VGGLPKAPIEPGTVRAGGENDSARELRRGAKVTLAAYVVRIAHPPLMIAVTRTYGAAHWGEVAIGLGLSTVLLRLGAFGLDRSMLYWVARHAASGVVPGLGAAIRWVGAFSVFLSVAFLIGLRAAYGADPRAEVWSILVLGFVPLAVSEMLLQACTGLRRLEVQLIVRDIIGAFAFLLFGLLLYWAGLQSTGLAWSYVLSQWLGLAVAAFYFHRLFRGVRKSAPGQRGIPAELRRYALPLWPSEVLNASFARVGELVVGAYAGAAAAGVYDVVRQIGNTVRSIRGSFDGIVTSVVASLRTDGDDSAVDEQLSYATLLVLTVQTPIALALALFADWLIPLFGKDFHISTAAVAVLCAASVVGGATSMAAMVINGLGRSRVYLGYVGVSFVVQLVLLITLTPPYGVDGAVWAVSVGSVVQGALAVVLLRRVTGRIGLNRQAAKGILRMLAAVLAGIVVAKMASEALEVWFASAEVAELTGRSLGYLVFLAIHLPLFMRVYRAKKRVDETGAA
jgi:O-antigen/teichoic acid export membrane protein